MNTRQLEVFVALADVGSLRKVGESMFMSAPAVKHVIDGFEAEIGLTLFVRSHAGVELTPSGKVFLGYARKVLALLDEGMWRAADESSSDNEVIYSFYPDGAGVYSKAFAGAYLAFEQAYPRVKIVTEVADSFAKGRFDLAYACPGDDLVKTTKVHLENLPLMCEVARGHDLASRESLHIEDLDPFELLVPPPCFVELMDEKTRAYIAARIDGLSVASGRQGSGAEGFIWCRSHNGCILRIGDYGRHGVVNEFVPIEGAWFDLSYYLRFDASPLAWDAVRFIGRYYEGLGV